VTQAPYSTSWENVPVGSYAITAKANDNLGAVGESVLVPVSMAVPPPGTGQAYFIETDQLHTLRLVTDGQGNPIWH
jgi:hypothetical protein